MNDWLLPNIRNEVMYQKLGNGVSCEEFIGKAFGNDVENNEEDAFNQVMCDYFYNFHGYWGSDAMGHILNIYERPLAQASKRFL